MLHEAVQHTCMALLRAVIGYRSTTHNISRLLALIENLSKVPSLIFPYITKEEKKLFLLLRHAYSDARYKEEYAVPAEKVAILIERVKQLMDVAEQLYQLNGNQSANVINNPIPGFPLAVDKEEP